MGSAGSHSQHIGGIHCCVYLYLGSILAMGSSNLHERCQAGMTIQAETCRICGSRSEPYAAGMVLDKYKVQYYSCGNCGFIQTESPYWLEEAYSSAIARSDIGLIGRNIKLASICSSLIPLFYDSRSS